MSTPRTHPTLSAILILAVLAAVLDKRRHSSSFARGSFTPPVLATTTTMTGQPPQRGLSGTAVRRKGQVKPFVLADIGEGITECEIVKWCVHSVFSNWSTLSLYTRYASLRVERSAERTFFEPVRRNAVKPQDGLDPVQPLSIRLCNVWDS